MSRTIYLEAEGRTVRLTNLDRVYWPAIGWTKGDMVAWYRRVAGALLPHLRGRPVTLHRFPEGVDAAHWYQTRCPPHPDWVQTVTVHWPRTGKTMEVCVIDDLPSLLWAANSGTIELHPYLARRPALEEPTVAVFDLDPGEPAGIMECAEVALRLRDVVEAAGLEAHVKTSGSLGLHVVVPVAPGTGYPETKTFARAAAALLVKTDPGGVTDRMSRAGRAGKVFVDWSQNDAGKSTVAPYSLRGHEIPTVSAPLTWDEVDVARAARDPMGFVVPPAEVLRRLDEHGDLHAGVLAGRGILPASITAPPLSS